MTSQGTTRSASTKTSSAGKVTITEVADHLGLTKGTVSRALNGYPDISTETQERVLQAASELGYRPSVQARALKTGRTNSVGLVLNVDGDNAHKPFLSDFLDGICRRLGEENWSLSVATATSHRNSVDVHQRLIAEKKVDGFILPRTKVKDLRVELLRQLGIPFTLYGRTGDMEDCAWFDISGEGAMARAVALLADLGHRDIAYIGGAPDNNFQGLRLDGFLSGLRQAGLTASPNHLIDGAMVEERGYDCAISLLKGVRPPTAIVCALDRAALGAMRAVSELGLSVGQDVSIIGYDGIPEGAYSTPPLTTFSVDSRQAGQEVANMLIQRIGGASPEMLRKLVDAQLIERQSHGPARRTSEQIAECVAAATDARTRENA